MSENNNDSFSIISTRKEYTGNKGLIIITTIDKGNIIKLTNGTNTRL